MQRKGKIHIQMAKNKPCMSKSPQLKCSIAAGGFLSARAQMILGMLDCTGIALPAPSWCPKPSHTHIHGNGWLLPCMCYRSLKI